MTDKMNETSPDKPAAVTDDAVRAVAIKPLEWKESAYRAHSYVAPNGFGENYVAYLPAGNKWRCVGRDFDTLEAAKAAAQADYEARIRSALVASPAPVGEPVAWTLRWSNMRGRINPETTFGSQEKAADYVQMCSHPKPEIVPLYASPAPDERLRDAAEALEPFATFGEDNTDDEGWAGTCCQRDRIVDWFGPSDFRRARTALANLRAFQREGE